MCSKLVLFILVTITSSVLGFKEFFVNLDDYNSCLPLVARPPVPLNAPSQLIELYGESFPATRHHIVPFSTLSAFFNVVLREDVSHPLGQYLARRVREIYTFFGENEHLGAPRPGREPVLLYSNSLLDANGENPFEVDNRMLAAFTWMPGNLFYGPPPSRRSNDPGMGIEENGEQIVGSEVFSVLRRIYNNMQNYTNNPDHRTVRMFEEIMNDLIEVDRERSTPYEFRESDWIVTGSRRGKRLFDIKGSSVTIEEIPDKHDELRKRSVGSAVQPEDYMNAANQVCEEFGSHLVPKINKNYTHVDIEYDVTVIFVYTINDKLFVYGQSYMSFDWFIKKVNKEDGTVGAVTAQGHWQLYYDVQIPYNIDGKQYFFGHNLESRKWFIQELKADGTMGRETSNGQFENENYGALFHIQIDGVHYLYGQCEETKNWFLRLLTSDGTLAHFVTQGSWPSYYNIQFPFKIGEKQYFAGLHTRTREHFIRDIDASLISTMGKPHVSELLRVYSVFFPISLGNKTYLFGHDYTENYWTINEVFGRLVEYEKSDYKLKQGYPFDLYGFQFYYAQLREYSQWVVLHFDLNYVRG